MDGVVLLEETKDDLRLEAEAPALRDMKIEVVVMDDNCRVTDNIPVTLGDRATEGEAPTLLEEADDDDC